VTVGRREGGREGGREKVYDFLIFEKVQAGFSSQQQQQQQ